MNGTRICSVDDCTRTARSRGWCRMHYKRWWKGGDLGPAHQVRVSGDASGAIRLARNVRRDGDCLRWTGAIQSKGYGQFKVGEKILYVHRVAYELAHGPIPEGLEIDHLCRVRDCVNPDHLEAVTHAENLRRKEQCPNGHKYADGNDLAGARGSHRCGTCYRASRAAQSKARATCECGAEVAKKNIAAHRRRPVHVEAMNRKAA